MTSFLINPIAQMTPGDIIGVDMGLTGSRRGISILQEEFLAKLLQESVPARFHHGMCRGADEAAHHAVRRFVRHAVIVGHPSNLPGICLDLDCDFTREPKPPVMRNHDIVLESNFLVALPPGGEVLRSGTWSTVRFARKKNMTIAICYPGGQIVWENGR